MDSQSVQRKFVIRQCIDSIYNELTADISGAVLANEIYLLEIAVCCRIRAISNCVDVQNGIAPCRRGHGDTGQFGGYGEVLDELLTSASTVNIVHYPLDYRISCHLEKI